MHAEWPKISNFSISFILVWCLLRTIQNLCKRVMCLVSVCFYKVVWLRLLCRLYECNLMGKTDYGVICVIQSLYSIELQFFQKLMHMLLFWILAQLNSIVIRTERKGVQSPAAWIFDSRFLLHLCPLAKSVITSALTVHCRRERGGEGENCLHKHGYMRASLRNYC